MTFSPSPQQLTIFDAIAVADHNILVDAKAGSGKTTTIEHGMNYVPRGTALLAPSIVFLAFNKNIVEAARSRMRKDASITTFHSLGFRALKDSGLVARNVKVDGMKAKKLVWNAMDREDPDTQNVIRLIDVAKGEHPLDLENPLWWNEIIRRQDISFEQPRRAVEVAKTVVQKTLSDFSTIDFADMLAMPIFHNIPFDPMDWIFVDEAQDLNGVQHEIVGRLNRPEWVTGNSPSRLVAVGDPHQAIYAFRGAHADSMEKLATRFLCKTYNLSVSFRCPKAVIKEVQQYLK